jgi:hypothetical protein
VQQPVRLIEIRWKALCQYFCDFLPILLEAIKRGDLARTTEYGATCYVFCYTVKLRESALLD